jgi:hypothetical protein
MGLKNNHFLENNTIPNHLKNRRGFDKETKIKKKKKEETEKRV